MKGSKVVPFGGEYASVTSLLAEVMNDASVDGLLLFTVADDGLVTCKQINCTPETVALAGALALRLSVEGSYKR